MKPQKDDDYHGETTKIALREFQSAARDRKHLCEQKLRGTDYSARPGRHECEDVAYLANGGESEQDDSGVE